MNDNSTYTDPNSDEIKKIRDQGNALLAKVFKANSILRTDSLDTAETLAVQKEDYELAAKIRDVRNEK